MNSPVPIGMIGCGSIAEAHAKAYKLLWEHEIQDFRIAACCDIDEAKASAMADLCAKFQGERPAVFTSHADLLQAKACQAVDICTVHRLHHEIAVPCMEAGLDVTVEKPLAITMRAGKLMLDTARDTGRILQVAEQYRRTADQRAIHWALQEKMIGRLRMLYWIDVRERLWYWSWREHRAQSGGGWSLDGGVHFADLFLYHIGPVRRVYCQVNTYEPNRYGKPDCLEDPIPVDVEDTTIATLEFDDGVLGSWISTTAAPGEPFSDRIVYGEKGSLSWTKGLKTRCDELTMPQVIEQHRAAITEDDYLRLFPLGITDPIAGELWEFIHAATHGAPLETDGMMGYRAEAVAMSLYESAHLGAPVEVAQVENLELENYQADLNHELGL